MNVLETIKRDGKLPGGIAFKKLLKAQFGTSTIKSIKVSVPSSKSKSSVIKVGDEPEGFGQGFIWDEADKEILLVAFVNSANPFGIVIDGVKKGDQIAITSASGIASFSESTSTFKKVVSSLVGLASDIGKTVKPEFAPLIGGAEDFIKNLVKPDDIKTKRRDPFGIDPGTGHKARQEGGVVVTLPTQGGPVYSGNEDHKERWIKANEIRLDQFRPKGLENSFFLIPNNPAHNKRVAKNDGEIYLLPWDWQFKDNAGFYKVFVHLKRGN